MNNIVELHPKSVQAAKYEEMVRAHWRAFGVKNVSGMSDELHQFFTMSAAWMMGTDNKSGIHLHEKEVIQSQIGKLFIEFVKSHKA